MSDKKTGISKGKGKGKRRSRSVLAVSIEESCKLASDNKSADHSRSKNRKRTRVQFKEHDIVEASDDDEDSDGDEIFRQNLFPDSIGGTSVRPIACSSTLTQTGAQVPAEDREDDSTFAGVGSTQPKRKFKRAVLKEDIRMLDKAMRDYTVHTRVAMDAVEGLAEIFSPNQPDERKKIKRGEILLLLENLRESIARGQERMLAIATNQKSFQDGVGNLLLDVLRGSMSSSSNAVPVMPIARAKEMSKERGGTEASPKQKPQNVWDNIDDLFELMTVGRPSGSVERTRFTKDEKVRKDKRTKDSSSSTEEDEYSEFILPTYTDSDKEEEPTPSSIAATDYLKPGQLASAFFGLSVSTKVRGRIAPPCLMTSDWLNSAVQSNKQASAIDSSPSLLVGGGSKKSAQRRTSSHGTTTTLSFRRDSNVGAGMTEMSINVRKNMMPSVML